MPSLLRTCLLLASLLALQACAAHRPVESGQASWYGPGFRGKPTASGERFRPWKRTAAHRTLPFGTVIRVTRTDTGDHVKVVVNDRGPFVKGRVVDLSRKAARRVDMIQAGVVPVEVEVIRCRAGWDACDAALEAWTAAYRIARETPPTEPAASPSPGR